MHLNQARRVLQDSGGGGGVAGGTGGGAGGGAGADAVGAMMASTSPRWGGRPRDGHALRQHVSPKQQRGGAGHRRHSSFGGLRRSPNKAYPRDGETMSSLRRKLAQVRRTHTHSKLRTEPFELVCSSRSRHVCGAAVPGAARYNDSCG